MMGEYVRMTGEKVKANGTTERYLRIDKDYICYAHDIIEDEEYEFVDMILNRLAELEDKIENGTLVELPCKVGTTIYHLYKAGDVITEDKVFNYHFEICSKPCVSFENHFWYGTEKRVDTILVEHFGKYWFTDKAKAEARLKELKEKG